MLWWIIDMRVSIHCRRHQSTKFLVYLGFLSWTPATSRSCEA